MLPDHLDWAAIAGGLDQRGWSVLPRLLDADACAAVAALYDEPSRFRTRVVMARHGFGRGEYQYFAYPLPATRRDAARGALRAARAASPTAGTSALGDPRASPTTHADFLARCHAAGQTRPTPLLLRYGAGDYNCLHQDLYGEHVFPLQVAILLSRARPRLRGRRVRADRAAPAHAVARRRRAAARRATPSSSPCASGPCRARAASTASRSATASASSARAGHTLGIIFHDAA